MAGCGEEGGFWTYVWNWDLLGELTHVLKHVGDQDRARGNWSVCEMSAMCSGKSAGDVDLPTSKTLPSFETSLIFDWVESDISIVLK